MLLMNLDWATQVEGAQLDFFILAQLGVVLANQSQNVDTLGDKDNSDEKSWLRSLYNNNSWRLT